MPGSVQLATLTGHSAKFTGQSVKNINCSNKNVLYTYFFIPTDQAERPYLMKNSRGSKNSYPPLQIPTVWKFTTFFYLQNPRFYPYNGDCTLYLVRFYLLYPMRKIRNYWHLFPIKNFNYQQKKYYFLLDINEKLSFIYQIN